MLNRLHSSKRHAIKQQRTRQVTNLATFWNKIAAKYAQDPVLDEAAYNFTCERSISYLRPEFRALEIGCGTGSTALRLRAHVSTFEATDISEAMIQIARERQPETAPHEQVAFRVASAPDSFDSGVSYDAIFAHSLLHLIPDPEALLARVALAIPAGGYFISKTPCLGASGMGLQGGAMRLMIPLMQLIGKAPPVIRFFSTEGLEAMITQAGFKVMEAGSFPSGKPPSHYIVARRCS